MFEFSETTLRALCRQNFFELPDNQMVFFGLRGCVPVKLNDNSFALKQLLDVVEADYVHPRCTLGQWLPDQGVAAFLGSTVPHKKSLLKAKIDPDNFKANELMTGFYRDYRKGMHKAGKPTGHDAFRQINKLPVRRTTDDFNIDNNDPVEYSAVLDNLHAAWCGGMNDENFASVGCQVVVGFPKCEVRASAPETGPWAVFRSQAYARPQKSFAYVLLVGRDAREASLAQADGKLSPRARYGSRGDKVAEVQTALKAKNFYFGEVDGDFGDGTLTAVLEFQESTFGKSAADGLVGPQTAQALGIAWDPVKATHRG